MPIITNTGRIKRNTGRILSGIEKLEFKGNSATFPFSFVNQSTITATQGHLVLYFNAPTAITVDYGDGTVKTFSSSVLSGQTQQLFIFNSNDYYTSSYTQFHPKYTYADGTVKQRTVKISYDRAALVRYSGDIRGCLNDTPLNFLFYAHRNITNFATTQGTTRNITTIPMLDRITPSTNPLLTAVEIINWSTSSEYIYKIPINFLNFPLQSLSVNCGFYNDSIDTNIGALGTMPIRNSLTTLSLANITGLTTLPETMKDITALRQFTMYGSAFTDFPAVIPMMTQLTYLNLGSVSNPKTGLTNIPASIANLTGLRTLEIAFHNENRIPDNINLLNGLTVLTMYGSQGVYTSLGDISALVNLVRLGLQNPTIYNAMSVFPSYFNSFTKFRQVTFANSQNSTSAIAAKKIYLAYELISRNAPKTGANNGTIPYRGFTVDVQTGTSTATALGAPVMPAGFSLGVSDGDADTPEKQAYCILNQYGGTILKTT